MTPLKNDITNVLLSAIFGLTQPPNNYEYNNAMPLARLQPPRLTTWVGCAVIIFFIVPAQGISIYSEYMNNNKTPQIETHAGIGIEKKIFMVPMAFGIEYLAFATHGSIHHPKNNAVITRQNQWAIPVSALYKIKLVHNLTLCLGAGIKVYSNQPIKPTDIDPIEQPISINNTPIVQHYSEQIKPHPFYKIELSLNLANHFFISVSKSWSTVTNTIRYQFFDSYMVESTRNFTYEPISISIKYRF
jgi:hypothetical protein